VNVVIVPDVNIDGSVESMYIPVIDSSIGYDAPPDVANNLNLKLAVSSTQNLFLTFAI
jgi:hypothetical protein